MVMADAVPEQDGVKAMGPAVQRINAASRLVASRVAASGRLVEGVPTFEEQHAWQLANEPPLPALCLTSPRDVVVPASGVRAFAASLREASPGRDVRVVDGLDGAHCQLAVSDRERYSQATHEEQ